VAPIGLIAMLWVRLEPDTTGDAVASKAETTSTPVVSGFSRTIDPIRRRREAAIVAAAIAIYFVLLNASYAYWEGGWSYGPRHASPAIPFLCIGLAILWTIVPAVGRWILAALSAYGVAVPLVAVSAMPLPPANLRRPLQEFLWPAFRDGDLALNSQTMASGGVDTDFRAHHEPRAAFNLGMKLGLTGHASLLPLAAVWIACGLLLTVGAAGRRTAPAAAPSASTSSSRSSRASP